MPKNSEALRKRLADFERDRPAFVTAYSTASYAHAVEGASLNDVLAAKANLSNHDEQIEILKQALPEAERIETAEAEAARTEEERRRAEAEERARKALHKGAQTDLANWRRAAAAIPAACDQLAVALKNMEQAAGSFAAKIPDNAPMDPAYWRFGTEVFQNLIAAELARAGDAAGVELPGSWRA